MQGRTTSPARGPPPGVGAASARMLLGFSDRDICVLSCSLSARGSFSVLFLLLPLVFVITIGYFSIFFSTLGFLT